MSEPSAQVEHVPQPQPRSRSLWAGVWGAPLFWAAQFEFNYAWVPWICGHGHHVILHVSSIIVLVLLVICFFICAGEYSELRGESQEEKAPLGRRKFLALLGMFSSALFTLVMIAQSIPSFFIKPCWD